MYMYAIKTRFSVKLMCYEQSTAKTRMKTLNITTYLLLTATMIIAPLVPLVEAASFVNTAVPSNPNLTNGLVGHWTMDGGKVNWATGAVTDSSGRGNTGTVSGMATTSAIAAGKIGQALKFDGSNDFVDGSDISSYFGNQAATFSLWIKLAKHTPTDNTKTGFATLNNSSANSHYPWTDGLIYNGTFRTVRVDSITSLVTDRTRWTHVVITRDSNAWRLYENGQLTTSQAAGTWQIGTNWDVGKSTDGYYVDGSIDDVRIYNRALSASEITRLYQLGN